MTRFADRDMNAAIDTHLAQALANWFQCREDWLRHTVMVLSEALREGHACLVLAEAAGRASALPPLAEWQRRLDELGSAPEDQAPLVLEGGRLYLRRYWRFETELAQMIQQRLASAAPSDMDRAREVFLQLFPHAAQKLDWQAIAAGNAVFQRFSVIAGGPGTGKTRTVTRLLALLAETLEGHEDGTLRIAMAAPTGKAAQRLGESMRGALEALPGPLKERADRVFPAEATTLHRLLGVIPNRVGFRHNADTPLKLDVLLVDEVSMIDLPLMTRLFRALPAHTRVILLGDPNQLPSVAAGSVLADLVEDGGGVFSHARCNQLSALGAVTPEPAEGARDYVTVLQHSYRFDSEGGIGRLAGQVLSGQSVASIETLLEDRQAVHWVEQADLNTYARTWCDWWYRPVMEASTLAEAFAALAEFRVLCATRVGPRGSSALNEVFQSVLNPSGQPIYKGQPIMITENHYSLGLYNGDIGLMWPEKDDSDHALLAWFPQGSHDFRPLPPARLPAHETVYAMTIHKTQGSEFDHVALVLPEQGSQVLSRELIYTGLTRAKQSVTLIGSRAVWNAGVQQRVSRASGLAERIGNTSFRETD